MTDTIIERKKSPGCLWQILWFAFIGWWLGQAWMIAAWFFMITIIGIPVGIAMLNRIPKVMALREPDEKLKVIPHGEGQAATRPVQPVQVHFVLRVIYFLLVGWWLSAVWLEAAYALCMTYIGVPVGFWMFDRVPALLTLQRD